MVTDTDPTQRRFDRWLENTSEEEKFVGFILSNVMALHGEDIADLARQLGRDIPLFTVAEAIARPIYAQYADGYMLPYPKLRKLIRDFTVDQYGTELQSQLLGIMEAREEAEMLLADLDTADWFYALARRDFYRRDFTESEKLGKRYGNPSSSWLDNLKTL